MNALIKMLLVLIVKPIVEAIDRNTAAVERQSASIGREVAKWIVKVDRSSVNYELMEEVYSEMGFQPVEIVDTLYPNLGKADRRAKAQAISLRRKK